MPDPKNKKIEKPKEVDTTLADNMKMVLEKHKRQNNQPIQEDRKVFDNKFANKNFLSTCHVTDFSPSFSSLFSGCPS